MTTKIIDVHHHILPDFYIKALENYFGLTKSGNIKMWSSEGVKFPEWSWDVSKNIMNQHKITAAITSISAPGVYFGDLNFAKKLSRQCNEYAAEMMFVSPNEFGAFATLPLPDIDSSINELNYSLDILKMDGIIMLSNYQKILLGNEHFEPLYHALNERKAVVFMHPTIPTTCCPDMTKLPGTMFEFACDSTRTIISMLTSGIFEKFPHIKFIMPHAGGFIPYASGRLNLYESIMSPAIFEKAPKGVDHYLKNLYYDTAMLGNDVQLRCFLDYIPIHKIVFGTDSPNPVITRMTDLLQDNKILSEEKRKLIFSQNAYELFPRFKNKY
jgi:predicted TIM-barrel fold metal-dependent hydrolase